jgi:hypothetical protein
MLAGQPVHLDHDDQDPTRYLGYSHRSCNVSAGAARGNAMRAAAYRAAKGLPPSPNGSAVSMHHDTPPAEEAPKPGTIRELPDGRLEVWGAYGWSPASRRW